MPAVRSEKAVFTRVELPSRPKRGRPPRLAPSVDDDSASDEEGHAVGGRRLSWRLPAAALLLFLLLLLLLYDPTPPPPPPRKRTAARAAPRRAHAPKPPPASPPPCASPLRRLTPPPALAPPPDDPTPPPPPPLPPPPAAPRASPPPPPAPDQPPLVVWEKHAGLNCWWDGHGAEEVDSPSGSAVAGVASLAACHAACLAAPQCDGVLFERGGRCFRKARLDVSRCSPSAQFDLYVHNAARPPSPPAAPRAAEAGGLLAAAKCSAMMREREGGGGKFFRMWSAAGWTERREGEKGCWGGDAAQADRFFRDAAEGMQCNQNWDEQNGAGLNHAPAVFGTAEAMEEYCNVRAGGGQHLDLRNACRKANLNLLRIGNWNMCRNSEWTLCATLGRLHNQGDGQIHFALPPKELDLDLFLRKRQPPNSQGWTCCGSFAENDIYYLEVCTLSEMCANSDELFSVGVGDPFYCKFDPQKYKAMQLALRQWD
ncbi:hypothetical protein AB1Y20_011603 [Prymnesium parvum]|uniref:Apple domain-containing protein n=1 Tax=Prymnesium parvum TaxID=97485 RepID=A0AB34IJV4_PRYPA